jgi:hypothetical protein
VGEPRKNQTGSPTDDADLRSHLRIGKKLAHPSVMFRRSAILAVGNYRDMTPGQDYDLWCRVAERYRMAKLSEPLVCYRMHSRSVTAANLSRAREISEAIKRHHHDRLWPGVDPVSLARLQRLLAYPAILDVTLQDWRVYRDAATLAAIRCGESADYFRRTARFRHHARCLLTRCAKRQPVLRTAWPILRSLRYCLPPTTFSLPPSVQYQPIRQAACQGHSSCTE